jgi:hypothetical protein
MFRVIAKNFDESFDRWTDALEAGNQLKKKCRSLLQDVRILDGQEVVWVYSLTHRHPMYFGPGTYDRLVKLFIAENSEDSAKPEESPDP